MYRSTTDPNPFRRALESVRAVEVHLIRQWLMNDKAIELDIAKTVDDTLRQHGLTTAKTADLGYLGLVLARNGWITVFHPFFEEALVHYTSKIAALGTQDLDQPIAIPVQLYPIPAKIRELLFKATPNSANTWHSRLSSQLGKSEQALVSQVIRGLKENQPGFSYGS
jgi:hypothetical protein